MDRAIGHRQRALAAGLLVFLLPASASVASRQARALPDLPIMASVLGLSLRDQGLSLRDGAAAVVQEEPAADEPGSATRRAGPTPARKLGFRMIVIIILVSVGIVITLAVVLVRRTRRPSGSSAGPKGPAGPS